MPKITKKRAAEATIATVEAAYDLKPDDDGWFPKLMDASLPLLDHGLGVGGLVAVKSPLPGLPTIEAMHVAVGPEDLVARHYAATRSQPVGRTHEQTQSGPFIMSKVTAQHPDMRETWKTYFPGAEDCIGYMTVDTDGRGIHILAPTPQLVELTESERARWEMIAAHVASGVRLRNALRDYHAERVTEDAGLPHGAEAIINPTDFKVSQAIDGAAESDAIQVLRDAAVRVDKARVNGRDEDQTDNALSEWWALLQGRWSIVDWFDTDDRRYVLALPNPPKVPNPRGLTHAERQVVAFAALGDSHKLVAYRLGLSRSHVSNLLASAMRKLSIKTQAQLVERIHALAVAEYRRQQAGDADEE